MERKTQRENWLRKKTLCEQFRHPPCVKEWRWIRAEFLLQKKKQCLLRVDNDFSILGFCRCRVSDLPCSELRLLITFRCFFFACRIIHKVVFRTGVRFSLIQNFFGFIFVQLFKFYLFLSKRKHYVSLIHSLGFEFHT